MTFRQEALERSYGNRSIDLASPAGSFTRMSANPATDAGQRIGGAGESIGLFESSFRDQADVAPRIGVSGTRHHAGEVGIQPVPIDLFIFIALQHDANLVLIAAWPVDLCNREK